MAKHEDYRIETEAGRIALRDSRAGALPILLLHGSGFSRRVFDAQFADPALAPFRLIAIDLPGHGESDDADDASAYTLAGMARAVAAVIEELGLSRPLVAGWSLGGHIAIEMLGSGTALAGLALCGTPPLAHGALGMIRGFHFTLDMLMASKARLSETEALRFEKLSLGTRSDGRFVETILRTDDRLRPTISRDMIFGDICDQLETVVSSPVPVCLIQGEHDPLVRTGYVRKLKSEALYEGGCRVIADAGHAPFMEQPAAFDAVLARFARDVAGGAASTVRPEPLRKAG